MQAIMLTLHTRTAFSSLDCNGLVCFTFNAGVHDRALKNCSKVEKDDRFLLPQHFCHSKFLTKCFASETEVLTVDIVHW
jgi:hypothetical protein